MALLVYVDDIVLASNNVDACKHLKDYFHACFSIKDLGSLKYFLGIEVRMQTTRNIFVPVGIHLRHHQ